MAICYANHKDQGLPADARLLNELVVWLVTGEGERRRHDALLEREHYLPPTGNATTSVTPSGCWPGSGRAPIKRYGPSARSPGTGDGGMSLALASHLAFRTGPPSFGLSRSRRASQFRYHDTNLPSSFITPRDFDSAMVGTLGAPKRDCWARQGGLVSRP